MSPISRQAGRTIFDAAMLKSEKAIEGGSMAKTSAGVVLFRPDVELLEVLLRRLTDDGIPILVFANGKLTQQAETALYKFGGGQLHVQRSKDNVGLGAGLNAIAQAAFARGDDAIVLFDQDSTPERGLVQQLCFAKSLYEAETGKQVGAIGPVLVPPTGGNYLAIRYWRRVGVGLKPRGLSEVQFLPTSGSLVTAPAWTQTGPFRADYFIGGIDVEWGYRARRSGFVSVLTENMSMVHRWGEVNAHKKRTPQILRQSPVRMYYYLRNAMDGLKLRHMPLSWKIRQSMTMIGQIGLMLIGQLKGRGVPVSLVWQALRDGLDGRLGPVPEHIVRRYDQ